VPETYWVAVFLAACLVYVVIGAIVVVVISERYHIGLPDRGSSGPLFIWPVLVCVVLFCEAKKALFHYPEQR